MSVICIIIKETLVRGQKSQISSSKIWDADSKAEYSLE